MQVHRLILKASKLDAAWSANFSQMGASLSAELRSQKQRGATRCSCHAEAFAMWHKSSGRMNGFFCRMKECDSEALGSFLEASC